MIIYLTDVCKACSRKAFWFLSQSRIMQHKCWSIYLIPDLCLSGIFFYWSCQYRRLSWSVIRDCLTKHWDCRITVSWSHHFLCKKHHYSVALPLIAFQPLKRKKNIHFSSTIKPCFVVFFHQQTHMLKLLMNELLSTMQEDKAGVLPGNSTVGS